MRVCRLPLREDVAAGRRERASSRCATFGGRTLAASDAPGGAGSHDAAAAASAVAQACACARRGSADSRRARRPMRCVWPVSFSIAATALLSAGATMVIAVPERPGAAGAADAVHVIVRMMRHVEIEHVAHGRDVEPARRDVGGDQQLDLAAAELLERGGARRLVHVAVQRDRRKSVADQRAVQRRDLALAVAEDDRVGESLGRADQAAQRVALVVRLAAGLDQLLR